MEYSLNMTYQMILFIIFLIAAKYFKTRGLRKGLVLTVILSIVIMIDLINMSLLFNDIRKISEEGFYFGENYHYAIQITEMPGMENPEGKNVDIWVKPYFDMIVSEEQIYFGYSFIEKFYTKYYLGNFFVN